MFVIAQLSDLHVNGTHRNRARIEAAFDYVNSRADGIDALLVTGDLTDRGSAEEMLEARKLIAQLGKQRAALVLCMTCVSTHDRHPATWDTDPVAVMSRWLHSVAYAPFSSYSPARDELVAIAALVDAHRDEFDGLLAGLRDVPRLQPKKGPR